MMNLNRTKTTRTTTLLFSLFLSFYIILSFTDRTAGWPAFYPLMLLLVGVLLMSVLVIVMARATMVTWITLLVLLAFAGKRRRRLVFEGRKITTDVAMYFIKVVVKERGLVAVVCAAIASLLAMVRLREVDGISW
ncbi:hypothetical protein L1049_028394 [Liquidambar formosana]|uniref:Uncharacterized protein n=1 Tax=Liquidambar formosana TaxID=63359 RepID=A0AAP0WWZ2_LIQFO